MKQIVIIFLSMMFGIVTFMIDMNIYGYMNRSMELKSNLASVVEETITNVTLNRSYDIADTEEVLADLMEALVVRLDSTCDVMLDILQYDSEKGVLAVKVTVFYQQVLGGIESISCEKNVILNRLSD